MKYIITIIVAVLLIAGFLAWQGVYYSVDPSSDETVTFLVRRGQDAKDIADSLERAGLIRYSHVFKWYVSFVNKSDTLKAGEYELSPSMTLPEIVDKIASGDMIEKRITIIEGWNLIDIGEYLEEEEIATLEQLLELDNKEKEDNYFGISDKPDGLGIEGYLFPDTYELSPEDRLEDIIRKMLDNFDSRVVSSLDAITFEIVTMASLIEKEVITLEDKKIVSGILWKRIEAGMLLQVDSTITYLTDRNSTEILKEELDIDSPYNTYKYKGLPLGPICNPGLESIEAAVYPTESEYWFYLSTSEGETIFSETLKEHNIAINKYLR